MKGSCLRAASLAFVTVAGVLALYTYAIATLDDADSMSASAEKEQHLSAFMRTRRFGASHHGSPSSAPPPPPPERHPLREKPFKQQRYRIWAHPDKDMSKRCELTGTTGVSSSAVPFGLACTMASASSLLSGGVQSGKFRNTMG